MAKKTTRHAYSYSYPNNDLPTQSNIRENLSRSPGEYVSENGDTRIRIKFID